ncbi:dentin sialophosphoprotein-like [Argiope bruennichi]|uniref:dentin sialophosphoprotein-like n=1 Tax=Argiope bruennichi TaxID=94029 RepID=UPI0024948352|nr:dentin sialophosphoprotein-like [Argiope bruennichi]
MESFSPDNSNQDTSSSSIEIIDVPKVCPPLIDMASSDSDPINGKEDTCDSTEGEASSQAVQDSRLQYPSYITESSDSESISSPEKITNEKKSNATAYEKDITKKKKAANKTAKELQKDKSTISNQDTSSSSIEIIDVPKVCPPLIDMASSDSDPINGKQNTCGSTEGESSSQAVQDSRLQYPSYISESSDSESISSPEKITNEKKSNVTAYEKDITKKKKATNKTAKEVQKNKSVISKDADPVKTRIFRSKICSKLGKNERKSKISDNKTNFRKKKKHVSEKAKKMKENGILRKSEVQKVYQRTTTEMPFPEEANDKSGASDKRSRATKIHKIEPPKYPVSANPSRSKSSQIENSSNNVLLGLTNRSKKRSVQRNSTHEKKKMAKSKGNCSGKAESFSKKTKSSKTKNYSNESLVLQNCDNISDIPETGSKSNIVCGKKMKANRISRKSEESTYYQHTSIEMPRPEDENDKSDTSDKRSRVSKIHIKESPKYPVLRNPSKSKSSLNKNSSNNVLSEMANRTEKQIIQKSTKIRKKMAKSIGNISKKTKSSKTKNYSNDSLVLQNRDNILDIQEARNKSNIVCGKKMTENRILQKSEKSQFYRCTSTKMPFSEQVIQSNSAKVQKKTAESTEKFSGKTKHISRNTKTSNAKKYYKNKLVSQNCDNNLRKSEQPQIYQIISTKMPFPQKESDKSDASDKHSQGSKFHKKEYLKHPVSANPTKSKSFLNKNSTNNVLLGMTNCRKKQSIQKHSPKMQKKMTELTENSSRKTKIAKKTKTSKTKKYCRNRLVLQNWDNILDIPEAGDNYDIMCGKTMKGNRILQRSAVPKVYQRISAEMPLPKNSKSYVTDKRSPASNIHEIEPPKYPVSANPLKSKPSETKDSSNIELLGLAIIRKKHNIERNSIHEKKKKPKSAGNFCVGTKNISKKSKRSKTKKSCKNRLLLQNCDNVLDIPEAGDKSNSEYKILDHEHPFYLETPLEVSKKLHTHGKSLKEYEKKSGFHKKYSEKKTFQKYKIKKNE